MMVTNLRGEMSTKHSNETTVQRVNFPKIKLTGRVLLNFKYYRNLI